MYKKKYCKYIGKTKNTVPSVIYKAFWLDMAAGHMNEAPNVHDERS